MATDDKFRQYSEAGEEFLDAARSRAVEFLRELARAGQSTSKQASDQVEDLVEAGRKNTDLVLDLIRKEIAGQLGALGLATKADLAALERRLGATGARQAPAKKVPAKKAAPEKAAGVKKAPAKKAAGATKTAGAAKSS